MKKRVKILALNKKRIAKLSIINKVIGGEESYATCPTVFNCESDTATSCNTTEPDPLYPTDTCYRCKDLIA